MVFGLKVLQHLLSLPMFAFLTKDIREGLKVLAVARDDLSNAYVVYAGNLVTQLVCVSGVNQLASVSGVLIKGTID